MTEHAPRPFSTSTGVGGGQGCAAEVTNGCGVAAYHKGRECTATTPPFRLIGPTPYKPDDFADWRSGILSQLAQRDPASVFSHNFNIAE